MKPHLKLLIVEMIIPPGNYLSITKLPDLEMLVITEGRKRTDAEFKTIFFIERPEAIRSERPTRNFMVN